LNSNIKKLLVLVLTLSLVATFIAPLPVAKANGAEPRQLILDVTQLIYYQPMPLQRAKTNTQEKGLGTSTVVQNSRFTSRQRVSV